MPPVQIVFAAAFDVIVAPGNGNTPILAYPGKPGQAAPVPITSIAEVCATVTLIDEPELPLIVGLPSTAVHVYVPVDPDAVAVVAPPVPQNVAVVNVIVGAAGVTLIVIGKTPEPDAVVT